MATNKRRCPELVLIHRDLDSRQRDESCGDRIPEEDVGQSGDRYPGDVLRFSHAFRQSTVRFSEMRHRLMHSLAYFCVGLAHFPYEFGRRAAIFIFVIATYRAVVCQANDVFK